MFLITKGLQLAEIIIKRQQVISQIKIKKIILI